MGNRFAALIAKLIFLLKYNAANQRRMKGDCVVSEILQKILEIIEDEAREADIKAAEACKRSKYSAQDYWMCIEFKMQRLHDKIAKEFGINKRCPHFPFRKKLLAFKKYLMQ
jgi:hypothetical protein